MAYKRKYKRSKKIRKRSWKAKGRSKKSWRARKWTRKALKITRLTNPFAQSAPDQLRTKLTYMIEVPWGFTAGEQKVYQISGNSIWDPDYSVAGTTAWMWPIYKEMYKSYMCTYSKCTMSLQITTPTIQAEHMFVGRILSDSDDASSWPSNYPNWYATRNTIIKDKAWAASDGMRHAIKIVSRGSTSKFYGRKLDPSLDLTALNSDPQEEWIHTFVFVNRSSDSTSVFVRFWVTYYVTFSELVMNNDQVSIVGE